MSRDNELKQYFFTHPRELVSVVTIQGIAGYQYNRAIHKLRHIDNLDIRNEKHQDPATGKDASFYVYFPDLSHGKNKMPTIKFEL